MKFTTEIIIERSRADVWKAFDNPDNMSKWQLTLKSFERVSGTPGQPGALSKLTYKENGREVVLMETVTRRAEPDGFDGTYTGSGVTNHIRNTFIAVNEKQTRWVVDAEFIFDGLMMKLLAPLMKGAFIKRTREDMQRFKQVAEG